MSHAEKIDATKARLDAARAAVAACDPGASKYVSLRMEETFAFSAWSNAMSVERAERLYGQVST